MICLGNICRSPLAEGIVSHKGKHLNLEVDSAGTAAYHIGKQPDIRSIKIANKYTIDFNQQKARQFSTDSFGRNEFSYSFHRTLDNHFDECGCPECEIRGFLDGKESHNLMSKVTDLKITGSNEVFAACYVPGDFLSPHQDSPNGIVGFVLHLTKDWKPEYGGLLHFLNDDGDVVENVETPKFNSLTLFLLPEDKGKLHYVSHVNPGTPEIRLSLTGWYRN